MLTPDKHFVYPTFVLNNIALDLSKSKEIPDWIHRYHPQITKVLTNENEYIGSAFDSTKLIQKNLYLINQEAVYIINRLHSYDKINFFDIGDITGLTALDMLLPIIDQNKLARYIAVSYSELISKHAADYFGYFQYNNQGNWLNTKVHSVVSNLETNNFKSEVQNVSSKNKDENCANLFYYGNSSLGNSINPKKLIQNIYKSMNEGDYLVVSQDIYRPGSEDSWVSEYQDFFDDEDSFTISKDFNKYLSGSTEMEISWEESKSFKGVKIKTAPLEKATNFAGVDIEKGEQITWFRTARLTESDMQQMFKKVGFKMVSISYGDNYDTAMFFLKKG